MSFVFADRSLEKSIPHLGGILGKPSGMISGKPSLRGLTLKEELRTEGP